MDDLLSKLDQIDPKKSARIRKLEAQKKQLDYELSPEGKAKRDLDNRRALILGRMVQKLMASKEIDSKMYDLFHREFMALSEADKADLDDAKAIELIEEHPTLLKRPVFVSNDNVVVGFDAKAQEAVRALV